MGPPAGFEGFLNRKYDIQQSDADARNALLNAQTKQVAPDAAATRALHGAQTYATTQQGGTYDPLAQAQIGEAGARSQLYGAQGNYYGTESRVQGLNLTPIGDVGASALYNGMQPSITAQSALRLGGSSGGSGLGSSASIDEFIKNHPGVTQGVQGNKKGTANVKPKGGGAKAPTMPAGGLAGMMAALGAGGAGSPPMSPAGSPGAPSGPMPGASPGPMGFFGGATQVPGQGSGNVDKVPAMLAPHEAVLTKGAAQTLGRSKIAQLNKANPPGKPTAADKKPMLPMKRPPMRAGMV